MAGESIKPVLFLPPGTTPTAAAVLIVQTLECKILACKCELSKDILQYALKILLCEDDSDLYPNNKDQSINNVLQNRSCTNAAMQTDNRKQHHASVQTEKCRIKLQNSGYQYTFNGTRENYDAATQVTFNDFSDISVDECEEIETSIDSPTEILKSKQLVNGCDNQVIPHTAKHKKKHKSDKHISLVMDFHGKRLIDETKNRPPFNIPLVCAPDAELCDPRTFSSSNSNKSDVSSHFPWRARTICNCTAAFKQKRYHDQRQNDINSVTLIDEVSLATDTDFRDSLVTPLSSVSPNRLNTKSENCCDYISKQYTQRVILNKSLAKVRRATIAEGITEDLCKDAHLVDCFCNLAPREACASDPRIKLICADVYADMKTSMRRHSSSSDFLAAKKAKLENIMEHSSVTSSTTEQFGCLTPNESPSGSPETPVNLTCLSPEPFHHQRSENSHVQKQQVPIIESQTLVSTYKDSKEITSANNSSSSKINENNIDKSVTPSPLHLDSNIEYNQVNGDLSNQQFVKNSKILRNSCILTDPSLLSSRTENIPVSPIANKHKEEVNIISNQNTTFFQSVSNTKKSTSPAISSKDTPVISHRNSLDHNVSCSVYHNGTMLNKGCLQTKDNYKSLIENKNAVSHNTSISELHRVTIDQQKESKIRVEMPDKMVSNPIKSTLQKILNSHLSEDRQSKPVSQPKIDINFSSDLLDITSCATASNETQSGKEAEQVDEIYSPTDELSIGSDCDTLPTGCTIPSSPGKSPILELDKSEQTNKIKENESSNNTYQKVIAAVPSYMPTRHPSLPSLDKPPVPNSDKCDKVTNSTGKTMKADNKTESEPDSTVLTSTHSGMKVENEMTQTEPEMKEWSSWFQTPSLQNYYKWCGQAGEFGPTHYQTYYPPYTNNYPTVASNWMCYQWWNGNNNGWNHLW